jgi:hypothetical protein
MVEREILEKNRELAASMLEIKFTLFMSTVVRLVGGALTLEDISHQVAFDLDLDLELQDSKELAMIVLNSFEHCENALFDLAGQFDDLPSFLVFLKRRGLHETWKTIESFRSSVIESGGREKEG